VSRAETIGIAHVIWFVSAIYFIAGPTLAYLTAVAGFGLVAAGASYTTFRVAVVQFVQRRRR
jgi:hypothetical protein